MSFSLQKANLWKRISAFMFDMILTVIVTVGFATVVAAIVQYDAHLDRYQAQQERYSTLSAPYYEQIEEEFGVDLKISDEEKEQLTSEEQAAYNEENLRAAKDKLEELLETDAEIIQLAKSMQQSFYKMFNMSVLIISISLFLATFIFYFVLPLLFKNGQTLGKKIFGIAVIRTNGVRISNFVLFVRSVLGMYTIELMVPVILVLLIYFGILGIVGTITIGLLLLLEIGVMIATKTNSSIHDLLSDTVVVDMASQQIFESEAALKAYEEARQADAIANGEQTSEPISNE